jgi:hypothetical protein
VVTALSNVSVTGTLTATGSVTTATNLNVGGSINVTNKAETRTNLGIPLAALTNTNVTNFRTAIELGTTNQVQFGAVYVGTYRIEDQFSGLTFVEPANEDTVLQLARDDNPVYLNPNYWNDAGVRSNLGLGATDNVTFSNVTASGTLTATSTLTAKTNLVVDGFVDFTTNRAATNGPTNAGNFNTHAVWITIKAGTNTYFLPAYK